MPAPVPPSQPQLISLRTISTEGAATFDWHEHAFEEFSFVTDDDCMIGHPPGYREVRRNTLLLYRRGEKHGAWVSPRQRPRFWVVHFEGDASLYPALRALQAPDPAQRVWHLTSEQGELFQWLFLQLLNEHSGGREQGCAASSSWLQLLLIYVQRWAARAGNSLATAPTQAQGEVLRLWHLINQSVSRPNEELKAMYSSRNYDSVRHAFRRAFGCSPREMLLRLRMEHGKNLLLETPLSIKEIAQRVGYDQPNDFNRLFHRYFGIAPSQWRTNPFARQLRC